LAENEEIVAQWLQGGKVELCPLGYKKWGIGIFVARRLQKHRRRIVIVHEAI
jgi:hypothetical protein